MPRTLSTVKSSALIQGRLRAGTGFVMKATDAIRGTRPWVLDVKRQVAARDQAAETFDGVTGLIAATSPMPSRWRSRSSASTPHRALRRAGARRRALAAALKGVESTRVPARARQAGGLRLRTRGEAAGAEDGEGDPRPRGRAHPVACRRRARGRDLPRARTAAPEDRGMIARLRGRPVATTPDGLVLDVDGVGYLVAATPSAVRAADGAERSRRRPTCTYAKTRCSSTASPSRRARALHPPAGRQRHRAEGRAGDRVGVVARELRRAIVREDIARFEAIPGIGKKTAQRVVLELKEKLGPGATELAGDAVGRLARRGARCTRRARLHARRRRARARRPPIPAPAAGGSGAGSRWKKGTQAPLHFSHPPSKRTRRPSSRRSGRAASTTSFPRDLEQALLHAMVEPRAAEDELAQPVDERLPVHERHPLPVADDVHAEPRPRASTMRPSAASSTRSSVSSSSRSLDSISPSRDRGGDHALLEVTGVEAEAVAEELDHVVLARASSTSPVTPKGTLVAVNRRLILPVAAAVDRHLADRDVGDEVLARADGDLRAARGRRRRRHHRARAALGQGRGRVVPRSPHRPRPVAGACDGCRAVRGCP